MRLRELLADLAGTIGGEDARGEAEVLLAHVLGRDRGWLYAHDGDVLVEADVRAVRALAERRARGEPVAYLTDRREFWSLPLRVTPAVLIPRPETEWLVELALARIPLGAALRIADLGTGSGAIALALAKERPAARVVAVDASRAALEVARANAVALGIANVEFREGDWCAPLAGERFDLVVSNPPYLAADDPHLAQGDLRHEPAAALVSGVDGLDAIRTIVAQARGMLARGGWLMLEHGATQGAAVRGLLTDADYADVFTEPDLARRDRVSGGKRS